MKNNFYDTLGLNRHADEKQVKDAYRRLAREHHPDVNPGDADAGERFKRVNEAYHVLSDKKRRSDYDEYGEHWARADDLRKAGADGRHGRRGFTWTDVGSSGGSGGGIGDIFSRFGFGGDTERTTARPRSAAQSVDVRIDLREAYEGATRIISYVRRGACTLCNGIGRRGSTICANCGGSGQGSQPVRLEVTIPAGIEDGGKIRLRPDDSTELIIKVSLSSDPIFKRVGSDLHTTVRVPLTDAVLGGEVEIPTMTGRAILKIPSGTQNGKVFRLAGKGMPAINGNDAGTLFATMSVLLPEVVSDAERRLFEDLRRLWIGDPEASESDS